MLMDYGSWSPDVKTPVFIAPGAYVIGQVTLLEEGSVWFNAVIRADAEAIRLGARSNVQDNATLHADAGFPCLIGREVTIGHGAIVHGARVEDRVLIGMGSIIMNGAVVHSDVIVGAGALITEGTEIPPGVLVLGHPARVIRPLTEAERAQIVAAATHYVERWQQPGWALS
jgi:carbonic anhydrase/acetyltransferase-like protein (isoleucine patch superfamily)